MFRSEEPLQLKYGGVLPELEVAYETWGELNEERDNAVIISAGLSAASHAKSHPVGGAGASTDQCCLSAFLYGFENVSFVFVRSSSHLGEYICTVVPPSA